MFSGWYLLTNIIYQSKLNVHTSSTTSRTLVTWAREGNQGVDEQMERCLSVLEDFEIRLLKTLDFNHFPVEVLLLGARSISPFILVNVFGSCVCIYISIRPPPFLRDWWLVRCACPLYIHIIIVTSWHNDDTWYGCIIMVTMMLHPNHHCHKLVASVPPTPVTTCWHSHLPAFKNTIFAEL